MYTIILAAGLKKIKYSKIPAVLKPINKIPTICNVIEQVLKMNTKEILIVVGRGKTIIEFMIQQHFSKRQLKKIKYITQEYQIINEKVRTMGTGDAINCCIPYLKSIRKSGNEQIIILPGDIPFINNKIINLLLSKNNSILTSNISEPLGCGRVFTNKYDIITNIIEENECNIEEEKCCHINCGVYNLNINTIVNYVPLIRNDNNNHEFYLTDIVEVARIHGIVIHSILLSYKNAMKIFSVNSQSDIEISTGNLQN